MNHINIEVLDSFRFHDGAIYDDVEKNRKFNELVWERMQHGDTFVFDGERGIYDCDEGLDAYQFPMHDYLLSLSAGYSLPEILGPDVRIVTQRQLIKDLLLQIMFKSSYPVFSVYCERFGNILFLKPLREKGAGSMKAFYLDRRLQFFNGDDLPNCVGSTPVGHFTFPAVGKAYNILSVQHGDARVVYSCAVRNYGPDGESIESTIVRGKSVMVHRQRVAALKAVTGCTKHNIYMKMFDGKLQVEFFDAASYLTAHPEFESTLQKVFDVLLDKRIRNFLACRRACIATFERDPDIRLRPQNLPKGYKSFLSDNFFQRFFDD